uniref:Uncharacterized protein n=1 Tax=Rhizophora mucronata TaxID=61149 RepID=A0A2P2JJL0_RHIMU
MKTLIQCQETIPFKSLSCWVIPKT